MSQSNKQFDTLIFDSIHAGNYDSIAKAIKDNASITPGMVNAARHKFERIGNLLAYLQSQKNIPIQFDELINMISGFAIDIPEVKRIVNVMQEFRHQKPTIDVNELLEIAIKGALALERDHGKIVNLLLANFKNNEIMIGNDVLSLEKADKPKRIGAGNFGEVYRYKIHFDSPSNIPQAFKNLLTEIPAISGDYWFVVKLGDPGEISKESVIAKKISEASHHVNQQQGALLGDRPVIISKLESYNFENNEPESEDLQKFIPRAINASKSTDPNKIADSKLKAFTKAITDDLDITLVLIMASARLGLRDMHAKNILHRDFAGRNILIQGGYDKTSEQYVLRGVTADYGLAREMINGVYKFTPEDKGRHPIRICNNETCHSNESILRDQYSFKVTFLEMLASVIGKSLSDVQPYNYIKLVMQGDEVALQSFVNKLEILIEQSSLQEDRKNQVSQLLAIFKPYLIENRKENDDELFAKVINKFIEIAIHNRSNSPTDRDKAAKLLNQLAENYKIKICPEVSGLLESTSETKIKATEQFKRDFYDSYKVIVIDNNLTNDDYKFQPNELQSINTLIVQIDDLAQQTTLLLNATPESEPITRNDLTNRSNELSHIKNNLVDKRKHLVQEKTKELSLLIKELARLEESFLSFSTTNKLTSLDFAKMLSLHEAIKSKVAEIHNAGVTHLFEDEKVDINKKKIVENNKNHRAILNQVENPTRDQYEKMNVLIEYINDLMKSSDTSKLVNKYGNNPDILKIKADDLLIAATLHGLIKDESANDEHPIKTKHDQFIKNAKSATIRNKSRIVRNHLEQVKMSAPRHSAIYVESSDNFATYLNILPKSFTQAKSADKGFSLKEYATNLFSKESEALYEDDPALKKAIAMVYFLKEASDTNTDHLEKAKSIIDELVGLDDFDRFIVFLESNDPNDSKKKVINRLDTKIQDYIRTKYQEHLKQIYNLPTGSEVEYQPPLVFNDNESPSKKTISEYLQNDFDSLSQYQKKGEKSGGKNDSGKYGGVYVKRYIDNKTNQVKTQYILFKQDTRKGYFADQINHHKVIGEYLTGYLMNTLIGDGASRTILAKDPETILAKDPKTKTLPSYSGDNIYIGSVFYDGFKELHTILHEKTKKQKYKSRNPLMEFSRDVQRDIREHFFNQDGSPIHPGLEEVLAASLLTSDFDIHLGNIGVATVNGEKRFVKIDHGAGLRNLEDAVHIHSHTKHLPGFGPSNHFRDFPREFRLSIKFAEELKRQSKIDMSASIEESMKEIQRYYGTAPVADYAKTLGIKIDDEKVIFDDNLEYQKQLISEITDKLKHKMAKRQQSLHQLSVEIKLSNYLRDNDNKLEELILENPLYFLKGHFHLRGKDQRLNLGIMQIPDSALVDRIKQLTNKNMKTIVENAIVNNDQAVLKEIVKSPTRVKNLSEDDLNDIKARGVELPKHTTTKIMEWVGAESKPKVKAAPELSKERQKAVFREDQSADFFAKKFEEIDKAFQQAIEQTAPKLR